MENEKRHKSELLRDHLETAAYLALSLEIDREMFLAVAAAWYEEVNV